MKTVAVTMVKDEADVIVPVVRHMLTQVDHVVVADNMSTDGTTDILLDLEAHADGRLHVIYDDRPAYMQSQKMTSLALYARRNFGADWIVPFDGDEVWYSPFGRIADVLADVGAQWLVVPAPLYDHVATGRDDPAETDPVKRIGWRRSYAGAMQKVACRWRDDMVIEQGNHSASYTGRATVFDLLLVVRHFPYRSAEQVIRKIRNGAAAYAAAGDSLPVSYGAHWRQWGQILDAHGEDAIRDLFTKWYYRENPITAFEIDGDPQPQLLYDPAPTRETVHDE